MHTGERHLGFEIRGSVKSGTGRGAKFISLPIYEAIFAKLLGKKPFPGTLNLKVNMESSQSINKQFQKSSQVFTDLVHEGKKFGGIITIDVVVMCDHGEIEKIKAVGVRPFLTSHDTDIIEIVSDYHLRECLELNDDDEVCFTITD